MEDQRINISLIRQSLASLRNLVLGAKGEGRTESSRLLAIAATKLQEAGWALREAEEELSREQANASGAQTRILGPGVERDG